mmetsp:Transcript_93668/g.250822  ORF Transcript_93668/g.250822 Transcript_93668/m.250822 type:complete len:219 (-) Transcript_93668:194-850(-)
MLRTSLHEPWVAFPRHTQTRMALSVDFVDELKKERQKCSALVQPLRRHNSAPDEVALSKAQEERSKARAADIAAAAEVRAMQRRKRGAQNAMAFPPLSSLSPGAVTLRQDVLLHRLNSRIAHSEAQLARSQDNSKARALQGYDTMAAPPTPIPFDHPPRKPFLSEASCAFWPKSAAMIKEIGSGKKLAYCRPKDDNWYYREKYIQQAIVMRSDKKNPS